MAIVLDIFKTKRPILLILLPIMFVLYWWNWLQNPIISSNDGSVMPFANLLIHYLGEKPLALGIISILAISISSLIIYYIIDHYRLLKEGINIPSLLYILFTGSFSILIGYNPVILASLFLLLAFIRLIHAYESGFKVAPFFDGGFLVGIAAGFYGASVYFVILMFIGMISVGRIGIREILATISGFVLPILFIGVYYFYYDQMDTYYSFLSNLNIQSVFHNTLSVYQLFYLGFLCLLTLVSIFSLLMRNRLKEIFEIKFYSGLLWMLLISVIIIGILFPYGMEILYISFIPVSFIVGRYFSVQRHKFIGDLFFILMIVGVIILQSPKILDLINL
ncbi:hypothetical protein E0494_06930 [Marinilabiliaceae bacterium JC040]|nr:hypothetical protein [Marinilabiliaceae bacterium JC040]